MLKVVGLFAGIGGIERGFENAGFECLSLCEKDRNARRVLSHRFPNVPVSLDVGDIEEIPDCEVVTAGFPCQDLSMAGMKAGINGSRSNVVSHLFRLLSSKGNHGPEYVVIENVAYMLKLKKGSAMLYLVEQLERMGYKWAYRTVDARSFGVPQRRHRVVMVASRNQDPARILFSDEYGQCPTDDDLSDVCTNSWYGFYWTEGRRGIGWARDSVPPIKGGSGVGIPSPPAIWQPNEGFVGTIDIRDAERLQGFPENWTEFADENPRKANTSRWRLVGNAVCVPKMEWLANRLMNPGEIQVDHLPFSNGRWPWAGFGGHGHRFEARASLWPISVQFTPIQKFLKYPLKPLSPRATSGYLGRLERSTCNVPRPFLNGIENHLEAVGGY